MLKRATQKALVRLRAFLQAEIILEIRLLRGELRQLGIEHQGLRATLDRERWPRPWSASHCWIRPQEASKTAC
jgi:hypothetical protein